MMELLGHTVAEEERRFAADGNNPSVPMPPWLLMAMMSTAQRRGQASNPMEAHGEWSSPGGDLATTAAESELRNALERRVAESLRSLDSVRALLQDPAGSARQGAEGGGAQVADDRAAERLASLTASLDPATALFEGTLREWLACRRRGKEGGERKVGGVPVSAERRMDSSRQGVGRSLDVEGSPTSNDALVLAFRCEAVGDLDPQVNFFVILATFGCVFSVYPWGCLQRDHGHARLFCSHDLSFATTRSASIPSSCVWLYALMFSSSKEITILG